MGVLDVQVENIEAERVLRDHGIRCSLFIEPIAEPTSKKSVVTTNNPTRLETLRDCFFDPNPRVVLTYTTVATVAHVVSGNLMLDHLPLGERILVTSVYMAYHAAGVTFSDYVDRRF